MQGHRHLDLASGRADQVHKQGTAVALRNRAESHVVPSTPRMVAHFNYNPELEGLFAVTVRQLGRHQLGIHEASLRQRNIRDEEHELISESYRSRHRIGSRSRYGHGQEVRRLGCHTADWGEELPGQWFQPRHDHSQGHNMDGGTNMKKKSQDPRPPIAAYSLQCRILPTHLGRLRKAISFGQVGDSPSPHHTSNYKRGSALHV